MDIQAGRITAQRLMALEVETLTGAAPGERNPDRINQRNGYRDRVSCSSRTTNGPFSEADTSRWKPSHP
jgi:transposase-like protein